MLLTECQVALNFMAVEMKTVMTVVLRIYQHDNHLLQWAFKPDRTHDFTQCALNTTKKILHNITSLKYNKCICAAQ